MIPFPPCLSRKRQSWEHAVRLRCPFPPACRGKGSHGNMACACDSLSPLPVEEKGVSWTWCALVMRFSFLPVEGKSFQVSPATPQRGLEGTPKVARELPSQKTINFDHFRLLKSDDLSKVKILKKRGAPDTRCSWTRRALAMDFSPCLSKKRQSYGLGVRLRWAFPPACRGKGCLMDLVCACEALFPLPVEEKPIAATWPARLRGPFPPACRGKGSLMDMACACDSLSPSACRGKGNHGNMACACDSLFPLPVEEKAVLWT